MTSLPLERRVLTISAREYCESKGKNLKNYKTVGVHYVGENIKEVPDYFFKTVPDAEIIVSYHLLVDGASLYRYGKDVIYATGIALVPRKKKSRIRWFSRNNVFTSIEMFKNNIYFKKTTKNGVDKNKRGFF